MKDLLKQYWRNFRFWRQRRMLSLENEFYRMKFQDQRLMIPDDDALRESVVKRFSRITPKEAGRLNILALWKNYNWENESLLPSLQQFGDVSLFEWNQESQDIKNDKRLKKIMSERLLRWVDSKVQKRPVDVMFCYISGEQFSPQAVEKLTSLGFPVINMYLNDKEFFVGKIVNGSAMGMRDICRHFHLCWTSTEDALIKYVVEGAHPIYLPEAANPKIHMAYNEEQLIDVSFVGQCYGDRPSIIQKLKRSGIKVQTFGQGWPNGPLSTEEMVRTYSRSKINLGFSGVGAFDGVHCLKGRDFEVPMSGGLYLTRENAELLNFFRPDEEIVTYSGYDDLVMKINDLLNDPEKRERIRIKGHERALREHSWEKRFRRVFRLVGVLAD